jgi:hypothetical protein
VLDPSRFSADPIQKSDAILRVSWVLMGAKTVPYVPKMYSTKEPPKHVWISIRILIKALNWIVLTCLSILSQQDVNVYRSMSVFYRLPTKGYTQGGKFRWGDAEIRNSKVQGIQDLDRFGPRGA